MPLSMVWYNYTRNSDRDIRHNDHIFVYYHYDIINNTNTVNASFVHQSTYTFTATENSSKYVCRVRFSAPTGIVVRGVQKQYSNPYDGFWSATFEPKTDKSEWYTCLYCVILITNEKLHSGFRLQQNSPWAILSDSETTVYWLSRSYVNKKEKEFLVGALNV